VAICPAVHVTKIELRQKVTKAYEKEKKVSMGWGLKPGISTPKFHALTTTPLGSQLLYPVCYHIIYVTQEETYIRRIHLQGKRNQS